MSGPAPAPVLDPRDPFWDGLRDQYPLLSRRTYLNNASIQPLPAPVARAVAEFARRASEEDPEVLYDSAAPRRLRADLALWLGCEAGDLALATSTSDGLIKAVNAVPWREGDEIVLPHNEFPSVTYPLRMALARGARVRPAGAPGRPVREEEVLAAVTPATRAAAFSWVSFSTGYRMDLPGLALELKARGVEFVIVDGMQGTGVWDPGLRATEVDFFAFQAVKWLAGPNGIGALYIRPGLLTRLRDSAVSWYSAPCCEDYSLLTRPDLELFPDARRYDGGTPPWINLVGLQAWLDLLRPAGIAGVSARMVHVTGLLRDELAGAGIPVLCPADPLRPSSILLLETPDPPKDQTRLAAAGIATSLRMGRVRVSPHVYNGPQDFRRLVEVLGERP